MSRRYPGDISDMTPGCPASYKDRDISGTYS
jgi:hypothetical protein